MLSEAEVRKFVATIPVNGTGGGTYVAPESWWWILFGVCGESGASHAFSQTAFSEKILFESPELLVKEVVGLMDQTDENVGHDLGRTRFDICPIGLI